MKTTLLLLLLLVSQISYAKYTQTCVVGYETESGWSKQYNVEVTFLSGSELNDATGSWKYSAFSNYAVIFWAQGEASVIKISTFLGCSTTVDKSCVTSTFSDIKGEDQDGDKWKICVSDFCF